MERNGIAYPVNLVPYEMRCVAYHMDGLADPINAVVIVSPINCSG